MKRSIDINKFILSEIPKHSKNIVTFTSKSLKISRQTAHYHLCRLIKQGKVIRTGEKKGVAYFLKNAKEFSFSIKIFAKLEEDRVWNKHIEQKISPFNPDLRSILQYGFTEIFNNVIEHSKAKNAKVNLNFANSDIILQIFDNGIGIFRKISKTLRVTDPRDAVLELSKGKFTTDPSKHTGEGIFFVSRIFDKCSIASNNLIYTRHGEDDFFIESSPTSKGTKLTMTIAINTNKKLEDIFKKYSDEDYEFSKTDVAVNLVSKSDSDWISRSQARRILSGLEKFKIVTLDFKGVRRVGQAFLDEIFRVFKNRYPKIQINYKNANDDIEFMIKRSIP